jgi:septal ring factor EnvC (AmiA/AmiB activator)
MKLNHVDYSFLKAVLELDKRGERINTSKIRSVTDPEDTTTDTIESVQKLSNSDVNNKIAKFGEGNSQVEGRKMITVVGTDTDYTGRGSNPKLIELNQDRKEEIERLLEGFNPTTGVEGFDSVQEALDYYMSLIEEMRHTIGKHTELLTEQQTVIDEQRELIEALQVENEALRTEVEQNSESLDKLRENVKPVVLGLVEHAEEHQDFDPEDYL